MNKNIFNKNLRDLVNDSFAFNADGGKWERQKENRIEQIFIGYNEYPGSYYPKGMSVSIKFMEVEDILNQLLDKYQIQQRYGESTIHSVLHNIAGVDYDKFKIEIHDESSFQTVAEEIKKIVEYGALPFFEKYSTLEKVFEAMEQMPIKQMAKFIGQPLPQRRMVIKKLCKDIHYEEYVNMVIDYYKSENEPDLFIIEKLNDYLNYEIK
jgi:hypothetical protein